MNRPTVLILASDPAFARKVTAGWPQGGELGGNGPEFIVLDETFCSGMAGSDYDLAIADASPETKDTRNKTDRRQCVAEPGDKILRPEGAQHQEHAGANFPEREFLTHERLKQEFSNGDIKRVLASAGKPAIVIDSECTSDVYRLQGQVIVLRREPGLWPALAGLIGREILRRSEAESRARDAEKICAAALAEAALGRYMVEMRSNINNALTTVLGNAELLALEPGLPIGAQVQADAIRSMALRLNEVFQRFSSIEKELIVASREPAKKAAHAAAGRCC